MRNKEKEGKTLVFCNGCFDILHAGHIEFLEEAKKQGDLLVVGLNSDESVQRNKGLARPVNNEKDRAKVLSALEMVDEVIIFSEENPIALIEDLKPDVFVNGDEYGEDCIEAPVVEGYGGRVHVVKKTTDISTSKIIEKIQNECKDN